MTISEQFKIVPLALAPDADRYNTDPTTDWIKCRNRVCFVVAEGAGGTGTAAITLNEASDNAGTGSAAMAFRYRTLTTAGGLDTWGAWQSATATGVTPAAGANKATLVEVRGDELTEGKDFVSLTLTEGVDSPVDAAVFAIVDQDFAGIDPPSIL